MPHGYPDYGVASPTKTIYTFQDIGELAARLGSVNTFDRRGNVMWIEDFEHTLKRWIYYTWNAEGDMQHTAEAARSGSFSVKLLSPTTVDKSTWMYHARPLPVPSKIGLEFSYSSFYEIKYLYALITLRDYDGQYRYQLRYDRYNRTLAYLNSGGGYTNLSGTPSHEMLTYCWNTIKLVVDYEKLKYVRALLNNFSWDLKNISGQFDAASYTPALGIEIRITNRTAGQHYIYIDDVILTQNEP